MWLYFSAYPQPNPASVEHMLSFNTLTPHYEEDVVYALNAAQVGQALGGLKIEASCKHLLGMAFVAGCM